MVEICTQGWYYTIDENIPCFMLLVVGISRPCIIMKQQKHYSGNLLLVQTRDIMVSTNKVDQNI